jgi:CheY-like chemotaxis protein
MILGIIIKLFLKKLPIIAVTAFALSGDENLALKACCDSYISKPLDKEKLKSLMHNTM